MLEINMFETFGGKTVIRFRGLFSIKDVREKVKAFKILFGRDPEITITGSPYDCRDGDSDFWPTTAVKVVKVKNKFLTVDHHGDVFDIYCPAEDPYGYIRNNDGGYYFDLF